MISEEKLSILTGAAKYDVSCSSSGSKRSNNGGLGNAHFAGICHSFTQDGRCISLLKILMSNDCVYDCQYCVNRRSNDVKRASATPEELCELVVEFYKRNYIEGLFLSSAIVKSPNYTMERLLETVKLLRTKYRFNGYIHVKGIPSADKTMIELAGRYADRMSFNIELPTEKSLKLLAPQKSKDAIISPMKMLAEDKYFDKELKRRPDFLPAGQTTQMIVGASPESDAQILKLTEFMYDKYKLKRVYYSSYSAVNTDNSLLPAVSVPLLREHRLYQADWLLRYYGFTADEITGNNGNLSMEYDPKCDWALRHMEFFPVEINRAPLDMLLRVPGIGLRGAYKIMQARRHAALDFSDLNKMRIVLKRAMHFITCKGKFFGAKLNDVSGLLSGIDAYRGEQLSLFSSTAYPVDLLPENTKKEAALTSLTGEF
ncbi:MAG: putative DNA modification/repair radical SAM protein [Clostridia bacterium]|nr:putative DNA modification/repair radical SAM protein [Clostridia bacterium]